MVHLYHLLDSPVIYTAEMRGILENTPPEAICTPRPGRLPEGNLEGRGVQIAELARGAYFVVFQFILTRGSVLPFFFPERECFGNYPSNSRGVLTVYKFNTLPLYKKE